MALRQEGRRVKRRAVKRRKEPTGKPSSRRNTRHQRETWNARERRQLLQLVVCGSIFVLLVVSKLLLPAYMGNVNQAISDAMERNMDVRAVFSTVGKAFSGESPLAETAGEIYHAVFAPGESAAMETMVQVPMTEDEQALDFLKARQGNVASVLEPISAEESEQAEADSLAYVLYSNQTLPECVNMEQVLLGFDYSVPVSGSVSSAFGYRDHPMEGEERFHYGIDLAADTGTEVRCFADGTVTAVGESSSYGKYCIVAHENEFSTLYAHCNKILVSSGASVGRGTPIAEVGETGMATGPHLHFELQRDGVYLNPVYYVSST